MSRDRAFLDEISKIIKSRGSGTLRDIVCSKEYAKIGDGFVNLAAVIASEAFEASRRLHRKVDNKFLKEVAKSSKLNEVLNKRMDTHDIGNAVEAILAFGWLSGYVSLEDVVVSLRAPGDGIVNMACLVDKILEEVSKGKW